MIINNLLKFSIAVVLVDTLSARENPFEETETYTEEKKVLTKKLEFISMQPAQKLKIVSEDDANMIKVKDTDEVSVKNNMLTKNYPPAKEVILKEKKVVKKQIKETIKPLPFIDIKTNDKELVIHTKYKMKKHFNLEEENKIVIDYTGKLHFYTKHNKLKLSPHFTNVSIGNHPKKSSFRVVIKTKDCPCKYKVSTNKAGLVTISR